MVHEAVPTAAAPDDPAGAPAWTVELQAQVGPFARSKRLRMVRTVHLPADGPPQHPELGRRATAQVARFERIEVDGRSHAAWTLEAKVVALGDEADTARLTMTLAYGGRLWTGAVLQRVLDDEVTHGSQTLLELARAS